MNDTLKTIAARYSCRDFTSQMPSEEQLQAIANAGVSAPSAMNLQDWRVIIVKNEQLIRDMEAEGMHVLSCAEDKTGYERIMSRGGTLYYHAPCMMIIPIKPGSTLDCGIVSENIALAATSLGLGNVICGLAGLAFSGSKAAEFKEKLEFPAGYEFGMAVLIGYAATETAPHTPDSGKISFIE